ncbi:MAG: mechanosensitive ion channel domain-containing protein [Amphritea sp.]
MNRLCLLFLLLLFFITPAAADIKLELEAVKAQLEQFEQDPQSTSNTLRETYQQVHQHLLETQRLEEEATDHRQQIDQFPKLLKQARSQTTLALTPLPNVDRQTQPELEQLLVRYEATLLKQQKQQTELQQQIHSRDQQLLDMRAQLANLQQQLNTAPTATEFTPKTEQQKAQALLDKSALREIQAKIETLELAILVLPGETELATLQLNYLKKQIEQYTDWTTYSESRLQQQSRAAAEKTLSKLEQNRTQANHPQLRQSLLRNQEVSTQLRKILADREATLMQRQAFELQLVLINQSYQDIQLHLELNIGYIGSEIRKHIQQLSKPLNTEKARKAINQLRLSQLALNRQQLDRDDSERHTLSLPLSSEQQSQFEQLELDYQNLLAEIRTAQQQQINELSQLLSVQKQINDQVESSRALFNKHLLWLPSTQPINSDWLADLRDGSDEAFHKTPAMLALQFDLLVSRLGWPLFLFILSIGPSWLLRNYLSERQPQWRCQIGNVNHDRISHTLKPILYVPLVALPFPLLVYSSGLIFTAEDPHPDLRNIFYILSFLIWLYLSLILWMKQPDGLLQGQLDLPDKLITTLRNRIQLLFWVNAPLIVILLTLDAIHSEVIRSGPSRVVLILLTIGFTLFWLSLWRSGPLLLNSSDKPRIWSNIRGWIVLIILFNFCMLGLILWGYTFSASILIGMLFILVCIGMLVYLLFQLGQRWLLIEERKLQFARVKARRTEILSAREEYKDEPPLKEDFIDLKTISAQGSMLLKTGTAIIFITLLWLTFGWTMPTLEGLDSVTLWSTASNTPEGEVLSAVSLKQLLFAFAALTITLIAARNLPGLLELLILNYLPLAPGSSFALSTLLKYLLIIIGLISFLNLLGLEWGKLQWLIAALGVGLGFGLQEIVANFVSGLIILFEKPVRIGDTVTIGGVTGIVSRIQIRATTITDWDRKEVIIPNKTFITDQLINWSLTDAITRIIIRVGVAYGSDTNLARQLLLQAAAENSHVLKEPEPTALFLTFGNSTLDFELRAHVSEMEERTLTIHELNSRIDQLFRQHNIEIAFPQLDVNLRTDDPDSK